MSTWKLQLFVLTLAAFISLPAYAQNATPSPEASAKATTSVAVGAVSDSSPIPKTAAPAKKSLKAQFLERKEAFKKRFQKKKTARQDKLKNMTPEQRQTLKLNLEEWFKALPLERQDEIKERMGNKKESNIKKNSKIKRANSVVTPAVPAVPAPVQTQVPVPESADGMSK